MSSGRNRILLVVDGSEQSFEMVKYASMAFSPSKTEAVLFHVMDKVPDAFWDWEEDPLIPQHLDYMKDWEAQKQEKMREFMDKARQVLLDAGFPADAITVKIKLREKGIARDIIQEAHQDYDALVVGRKGLSTIDEQLLGGVASKILGALTDLTICLVGGFPKPGRFVLGVDGSVGSSRAADFLWKMAGDYDPAVSLLHVVRAPSPAQMHSLSTDQLKKLEEEMGKSIKPSFDKITAALAGGGINPAKVSSRSITGAQSRTGALLKEARKDGYGTIVVGRRGLSKIEEFQMGRVANKLSQVARDLAVWIVS